MPCVRPLLFLLRCRSLAVRCKSPRYKTNALATSILRTFRMSLTFSKYVATGDCFLTPKGICEAPNYNPTFRHRSRSLDSRAPFCNVCFISLACNASMRRLLKPRFNSSPGPTSCHVTFTTSHSHLTSPRRRWYLRLRKPYYRSPCLNPTPYYRGCCQWWI